MVEQQCEPSEEELRNRARERVEEKRGFFIHLVVYVAVNAMLVILWAIIGAGYPWFIWTLFGWGIGILFHFLGVYVFAQNAARYDSQVDKELERLKRSQQG